MAQALFESAEPAGCGTLVNQGWQRVLNLLFLSNAEWTGASSQCAEDVLSSVRAPRGRQLASIKSSDRTVGAAGCQLALAGWQPCGRGRPQNHGKPDQQFATSRSRE